MATRKRITFILLWAMSLILVGVFAHAQNVQHNANTVPPDKTPAVSVLSGSDIGFKVQRRGTDYVQGTLVVRINGEWLPAEPIEKVEKVRH